MDPQEKWQFARKWIVKYKDNLGVELTPDLKESLTCLLTDALNDFEKKNTNSVVIIGNTGSFPKNKCDCGRLKRTDEYACHKCSIMM